mgnify:CR=1 FL=1|nr:MAG TPA: Transcriptional regulator [Caudoviricetes sp.]
MIDNMELGYTPNNLKALRREYGLTQQQVADITESTLKPPKNGKQARI